jgi:hypothetical protein
LVWLKKAGEQEVSRVPGGAGFGPNVTIVKAGQSVAAAQTAAAVAYAANGPQVVVAMPGAVWDNSEPTPTGVSIVPWLTLLRPREQFRVAPNVALVAIESDDGDSSWVASDGTLGMSPLTYCHTYGIPITHAVVSAKATQPATSGFMSIAQLRDAFLVCGHELSSQSMNHAAITAATLAEEMLLSRITIEGLTESSFAATEGYYSGGGKADAVCQALGVVVNGFSPPGDWKSLVDAASTIGALLEDTLGGYGQLLAGLYQYWVSSYGDYPYGGFHHGPRRQCKFIGINKTVLSAADVAAMATPGARYFFVDDEPGIGGTMARWKTTIDLLVAQRDAGKIAFVTANGLFNGLQLPPLGRLAAMGNTDAEISGLTISDIYNHEEIEALRTKCEELADDVRAIYAAFTGSGGGGLANGSFEDMAVANLGTAKNFQGWYGSGTAHANVQASGGNPTQYCQVTAGQGRGILQPLLLLPGTYELSFDAKYEETAGSLRAIVSHAVYDSDGTHVFDVYLTGGTGLADFTLTGSFAKKRLCFGVPRQSAGQILNIQNRNASHAIAVDNVAITRTG